MNDIALKILIGATSSLLATFGVFLIGFTIFKCRGWAIKQEEIKDELDSIEDKLNRKELSKNYYEQILENNTKNTLTRFSITGKYGYGKTFIINEIAQLHEKKFEQKSLNFKTWEQDNFYNPLKRILMEIFNEKKQFKLRWSKLRSIKTFLKSENNKMPLPMKKYIKKYKFLKSIFSKVGSEDKKILFLIDELDRSNPADAIEFLELTHHLFNENKNIIIIYSYDKQNLNKLVKKHLGIEDTKYLKKFIDFEFKILNENIKYIEAISKEEEFTWLENVVTNRDISISLRDIDRWKNRFLFLKANIDDSKKRKLLPQMLMILELSNEGYEEDESVINKLFIKTIQNIYGEFENNFKSTLSNYNINDFTISYENDLFSLNEWNKRHGMKNYEYFIQLIFDKKLNENKLSFKFNLKAEEFNTPSFENLKPNDLEIFLEKIYQFLYCKNNFHNNEFDIKFIRPHMFKEENEMSWNLIKVIDQHTQKFVEKLEKIEDNSRIEPMYEYIKITTPKFRIDAHDVDNQFKKIGKLEMEQELLVALNTFKYKISNTNSYKTSARNFQGEREVSESKKTPNNLQLEKC